MVIFEGFTFKSALIRVGNYDDPLEKPAAFVKKNEFLQFLCVDSLVTRELQRLRFTREALAKSLKAAAIEERTKALEVLQSVFEPDAWTPWEWLVGSWVFPKIVVPQNGWFIMEIPFKMDDLGVPLFSETPSCIKECLQAGPKKTQVMRKVM